MGFLKKIVKRVKKAVKKVAGGIKKVVKKISKSKILKTIALVGAALVTGGAAVGAFGGKLAASGIGKALITAQQGITSFLGPAQFLAKPFEMLGTAIGTGAGKVTDFLGATTEAGRLGTDLGTQLANVGPQAGQINMEAMNFGKTAAKTTYDPITGQLTGGGFTTPGSVAGQEAMKKAAETAITGAATGTAASTAGAFAKGEILGDVVRGVGTGVLTGAAMQYIQGEPDPVGALGAGYGEERGINLAPLEVAYAQAGVDMNSIYNNLTFGTADPGFLSSNLYQQPTLGVT